MSESIKSRRPVRHFDTAPLYGDGLAEREIGRMFSRRRDQLFVATKYGLPPDPCLDAAPWLGTPYRAGRAVLRRLLPAESAPQLTGPGLVRSVEASLRRLGFNDVDLLLLHDPHADRMPDPEGLADELRGLAHRGLIRSWGLSGGWAAVKDLSLRYPELAPVLQTADQEWDGGAPIPQITFGAMAGGPQRYGQRALDADLAVQRLLAALKRRPQGIVLVSTTKMANLERLARVASQGADDH